MFKNNVNIQHFILCNLQIYHYIKKIYLANNLNWKYIDIVSCHIKR